MLLPPFKELLLPWMICCFLLGFPAILFGQTDDWPPKVSFYSHYGRDPLKAIKLWEKALEKASVNSPEEAKAFQGLVDSIVSSGTKEGAEKLAKLAARFPHYEEQVRIASKALEETENFVDQWCLIPESSQLSHRKLDTIFLPRVEFNDASMKEVVSWLRDKSKELDPDGGRGINMVIDEESGNKKVTVFFEDSPLGDALSAICIATGLSLINLDGLIIICSSEKAEKHPMYWGAYLDYVKTTQIKTGLEQGKSVEAALENVGIIPPPGASFGFDKTSGRLSILANGWKQYQLSKQSIRSDRDVNVRISCQLFKLLDEDYFSGIPPVALSVAGLKSIPLSSKKELFCSQIICLSGGENSCFLLENAPEDYMQKVEMEAGAMVNGEKEYCIAVDLKWKATVNPRVPKGKKGRASMDLHYRGEMMLWDGEGLVVRLGNGLAHGEEYFLLVFGELLLPDGKSKRIHH